MDNVHEDASPNGNITSSEAEAEAEFSNVDYIEGISSSGDAVREVGSVGEMVTRIELDLACSAEKLVNLNVLMMHVATRETDFEAFVSDVENVKGETLLKAIEFYLLSVILDSEVRELDNFMSTIHAEIIGANGNVHSSKHLGISLEEVEERLYYSEDSLKQSVDQLSEIKVQSSEFQNIFSRYDAENNWTGGDIDFLGRRKMSDENAKIKMQTAEQQRGFLRMLEQSLAREMDLEKKVGELINFEEELKQRLNSSEEEVFSMEEEASVVWGRMIEAENSAEILMDVSKEILARLQLAQLNSNGSIQLEEKLKLELQDSDEQLKSKDLTIQKLDEKLGFADSEVLALREKVNSLEEQLKELGDLREKVAIAEDRAVGAETKCKLLTETNEKLSEDFGTSSEKVYILERQLRESDMQLQHALASVEASKEKESMLYSTVQDMENLIEDLKSRVSKAESRADNVEDKCITLSEFNSDLNEELTFLRSKLESLEASLSQAEKAKMATAKDINIRTKVIMDLVMQLALERERLHKQINSLRKENAILFKQAGWDSARTAGHNGFGNCKDPFSPKQGYSSATCAQEKEEGAGDVSATSTKEENTLNDPTVGTGGPGPQDIASELETVRNIDARQLNFKNTFVVFLGLALSAVAAAFFFQNPEVKFW